ncbi:MAG: sulfatase, partial [Armatimonadetes bacterium]|nr:sulfatase [Armatimonadota bacterium]
PRPNIVLILSDDHSYPHLGCYQNPDIHTPNLDGLAAAGLRCDRAYVGCPQCVPSRATLMTGRSAVGLGMTRFTAPLPREVVTLPELLREAGYFTGIAGRTFHLDGSGKQPPESDEVLVANGLRTFDKRVDFLRQGSMLPQFQEFLGALPADRPFFLWLNSSDPHRPLDDNNIPQPHDPSKLTLPVHYPDTPLVREDFARYYNEINRLDGHVGEVLKSLDQRGLAGNTLVVFMGDNGSSQLRGKGTLYEFGIHVPLLLRWPQVIKAGTATTELLSGEDLAPTLLAAAGVAAPPTMTGRSFLPLLRGESYTPRTELFAERGAHGGGLPTNSANFDLGRAVVTPTHKLIYNALWHLPYTPVDFGNDPFWKDLQAQHAAGKLPAELSQVYFRPQRPMFELYDLAADPREFNNLAGKPECQAIEHDLKSRLQRWMILERDYLPLPIPPKR